MGITQLLNFVREAAKRVIVIVLALILVMIVASRNVEFELEQEALKDAVQVESEANLP